MDYAGNLTALPAALEVGAQVVRRERQEQTDQCERTDRECRRRLQERPYEFDIADMLTGVEQGPIARWTTTGPSIGTMAG